MLSESDLKKDIADKSKVTVRVPKRLWKGNSPGYVEWREFRLKSRLMPNGYWVTLAAVQTYNRIVFGASACSPHDVFDSDSAYPRAIGRARQRSFLVEARGLPYSLVDLDIDIPTTQIYDGPDDRSAVRSMVHGCVEALHLYDVVARNAERKAIISDIKALREHYGYRFDIKLGDAE